MTFALTNQLLNPSKNHRIVASLVLYQNDAQMLRKLLSSIAHTPLDITLFVVDNSPTAELSSIFKDIEYVEYSHNPANPGFGTSHNLAISKIKGAEYYAVLNPDVYFSPEVIPELIDYLDHNIDIGLIQPKICFPNGVIQCLCKRYPSLFVLFVRRFVPKQLHFLCQSYLDWFEMKDMGYDKITDVTYLSGCFMVFRKEYLDDIGYFDENIFMYFEDADITIRMAEKYRSIFYPHVQVFHYWAKGSYTSWRLALINIQSAFYFFCKHGWKII
jgi:GT2 family glycosyltransferase